MQNLRGLTGFIFDIQGFSVHDGPGCRTVFFMGGCPLRCRWCANPEGIAGAPGLMHFASKCGCGKLRCGAACPHKAVSRGPVFDRAACAQCRAYDCVDACFSGALKLSGKEYSFKEITGIIRRDREFWGAGGGVTLSGGEPLFQSAFSLAVLRWCREHGISTAAETCAYAAAGEFNKFAIKCDWLFVDIKHMDAKKHKAGTGRSNAVILENIRSLANSNWRGRLVIRLPLVPGYNDDDANLTASAAFMEQNGLKEINILPFHTMGESKYRQLGLRYAYAGAKPRAPAFLARVAKFFTSQNINCYIGSETPF